MFCEKKAIAVIALSLVYHGSFGAEKLLRKVPARALVIRFFAIIFVLKH